MTKVRGVRRPLLATLVVLASMAGCTAGPSGPVGSDTVSGAPTSTPTESSMERQQREDFEAAETAYRTFFAEVNRLERAGGAAKPSALMMQTATGPYLKFYARTLAYQKSNRLVVLGGSTVVSVSRGPRRDDRVTIEVCEDGTGSRVLDRRGKQVGEGFALRRSLYAVQTKDGWKIRDGDDHDKVKSCAD